jgi:hypothetical protein
VLTWRFIFWINLRKSLSTMKPIPSPIITC